jgi:hypothetical protein
MGNADFSRAIPIVTAKLRIIRSDALQTPEMEFRSAA